MICLTNSDQVAIVDQDDLKRLLQFNWTLNNEGYAATFQGRETWLMHRVVKGLFPGDRQQVDHKNFLTLDNRKENLRVCSQTQNVRHQRKIRGISRFKGVCWSTRDEIWVAQISFENTKIRLGQYKNEIEAASAYDVAALQLFHEFAETNFYGKSKT